MYVEGGGAGVIYPHAPYQMSDIKLLPEYYE